MKDGLIRWLSTGLLLGSMGCVTSNDDDDGDGVAMPGMEQPKPGQQPGMPGTPAQPGTPAREPEVPVSTVLASLSAAADCTDLLTQIQNDAITKLKMQVEQYKKQPLGDGSTPPRGGTGGIARDAGVGVSTPGAVTDAPAPRSPTGLNGGESGGDSTGGKGSAGGPTSASDTNQQVQGVDEADFVKVVENGASIYLLHGNTLQKLKSWPAAETARVGKPLIVEGAPSEMFVTDQGKAVIFSNVYGYQTGSSYGGKGPYYGGDICAPGYGCGGGGSAVKITVADVSAEPKVERELYYEGSYLSSRRYAGQDSDVVRAVVQASSRYSGLYAPDIEWTDAWGRPYDEADIGSQLEEWEERTTSSIRKTTLAEWIPTGREVVAGKLVDIEPNCGSYFVPAGGLADYGLTHLLSLDVSKPGQPVGGITIVGAASTVYSNEKQLVLAQPDYRWMGSSDFGITNEQTTALHMFDLSGASTTYKASGWVFGGLPLRNAQFGIDVTDDGTVRVATTGFVRDNPKASPDSDDFWKQHTESYVITARASGGQLTQVGRSVSLGKKDESVYSARFVGDRAYVVTYRQIDPLYVLDVSNAAAPTVLGELEIPGFSEYMHPLDATHLITLGQSGQGGVQLQLFDVSNPKALPPPKTIGFGAGSSEVSYNHKALTVFDGTLAFPLYNYDYGGAGYSSTLQLLKVDASTGFTKLSAVDHAPLYAHNGLGVQCGVCDPLGCRAYYCGYQPELRRGHFVQGDGKTYVYSFSYAGVLVNDLSALQTPVARVGLPQPTFDNGVPWYGVDGTMLPTATVTDGGTILPSRDGGFAVPTDAGVSPAP